MSDIAIRAENLSKQYRIGARVANKTLREALATTLRAPLRWLEPKSKPGENTFWALDNVSFEIKHGEAIGIIGRNGAGKSTLLKILSRITKPTRGRVELYGRVGSLLEVGTGFHSELTGRENIFLNGAILGMSRREIERKFDEIVDFAEIEKFLDTPAKHYSSGMYMRLAFAVAAHLEPEILIVDEVLAVGDVEFQKKCLGKMGNAAQRGRTVLFVSHNMQAIRQLCQKAILIDNGKIVEIDSTDEVIDKYIQDVHYKEPDEALDIIIRRLPPDLVFRLEKIVITQNQRNFMGKVFNDKPLEIAIHYEVLQPTIGLRILFDLCDSDGNLIFRSFHDEASVEIYEVEPGKYISQAKIPSNILAPISYDLIVNAGIHNIRWCLPHGIRIPINVEPTSLINRAYVSDVNRGKLLPITSWQTEKSETI